MVTSLSRHPDEHQVTEAPHLWCVRYTVCVAPDECRLLIPCHFRGHRPFEAPWWASGYWSTSFVMRVLYCRVMASDECLLLISYHLHGHELSEPGWQEKQILSKVCPCGLLIIVCLCGSLISHLRMQIFLGSPSLPWMSWECLSFSWMTLKLDIWVWSQSLCFTIVRSWCMAILWFRVICDSHNGHWCCISCWIWVHVEIVASMYTPSLRAKLMCIGWLITGVYATFMDDPALSPRACWWYFWLTDFGCACHIHGWH